MLCATVVAPGHAMALPLMPEFIAPQDGAEKQDCARNAVRRRLAMHGERVGDLRPIFLGDDLVLPDWNALMQTLIASKPSPEIKAQFAR